MNRGDAAFAVDHKSGGERVDFAVKLGDLLRADHHAVVDFFLLNVRLHRLPAILIERDAEHGEILILICLLKIHEPGDLDFARAAPSGPEVEQDDFASVIGQLYGLAVGVLQGEIGRGLAIGLGFHGGFHRGGVLSAAGDGEGGTEDEGGGDGTDTHC